ARYFHTCVSWIPQVGHGCAWMSTNPGMIVLPLTSITRAPAGGAPRAPTDTMRLSVTTTSPFSTTSSPFMEMIRAPCNTTVPRGERCRGRIRHVDDRGLTADQGQRHEVDVVADLRQNAVRVRTNDDLVGVIGLGTGSGIGVAGDPDMRATVRPVVPHGDETL